MKKRKKMEGASKHSNGMNVVETRNMELADKEEEEKMSKFFSLVGNIREAQNHLQTGSSSRLIHESQVPNVDKEKRSSSCWTPSFTLGDFAVQDSNNYQPKQPLKNSFITNISSSCSETETRAQLDLNLPP